MTREQVNRKFGKHADRWVMEELHRMMEDPNISREEVNKFAVEMGVKPDYDKYKKDIKMMIDRLEEMKKDFLNK